MNSVAANAPGTTSILRGTIAFVTVLFNCEKHLELFFRSMSRQTDLDFRIIVVDNASKDDSLAKAKELSASSGLQCDFIANETNLGIAVGNNQGIERACRLGLTDLVLINNDIGCDTDLVAQIRRLAIGGGHRAWTCLAYLGDSQTRWYGGGWLSDWRARGMHFTQERSLKVTSATNVTYAPTCLMYLHSSVFDDVGMMDPEYFVYYDDTDFCKRLSLAGIALVYEPGVSFRHYVGGSSGGEMSDFFLRINTRNKFIYIRKHYRGAWKWAVTGIAVASKLVQLASPRRRGGTWRGLRDVLQLSV